MNHTNRTIIHETAVIGDGAIIGDGCHIGPYCCIGENVSLGEKVNLISHVVLSGDTVIGDGCTIYPFASIGMIPQDLKYNNERSRLEIGKNTVIRENVTVSIGTQGGGMLTKIGDNCLIMAYCHVAHDCKIGDNVILVNGVNLSGHVVIDDFAIVGGMSAVKQFTRIGRHAMIGGCTGVDRDVIPYGLVREERTTTIKGLNIIGLKRRGFSVDCIQEMMKAFRELFEDSENVIFTEKANKLKEKYKNNQSVIEIMDFVMQDSKNPICTNKPTDNYD
ncbi:MAG: acyl-ACP--UDP-N-acetylglucosamine O-acyltransferase [Holosporales bacterium]|jgi:UDP-N-acetylglucosamine acyltransferase|nr:acyl-ACP--UDP-N-acetylglucosamine O-acyltransferase [Holosporales bacterium]